MGMIFGFIGFMIFAFFWAISRGPANSNVSEWQSSGDLGSGSTVNLGFQASGSPARAILLWVDTVGQMKRYRGQRYDVRNASVDIEEPNRAPYVIDSVSLHTPSNLVRDALPGSTMEVRVQGNRVFVVGPDVGYAQGALRTS